MLYKILIKKEPSENQTKTVNYTNDIGKLKLCIE